ncbi:LITAF domain-containing protein [Tribolium castaneum]|nr:LITAF domain-containing protein [Tribolium madens]
MNKDAAPPPYSPPPSAPPSYAQAVGGVPPTSPYIPHHNFMKGPPILTTVVPVGPEPTHMICPHCHAEIDTTTYTRPGNIAYIAATLICLMGCAFGCCLIPCCIDNCMDVHHTCPNCKAYLGKYRR